MLFRRRCHSSEAFYSTEALFVDAWGRFVLGGVADGYRGLYAAEGAAAGAPPSEATETAPGIGVPTPLDEERSTLEQLRMLEKKETLYTPAAVSTSGTASSSLESRPWYLHVGLGYAFIGTEVSATSEDASISNEVDSDVYPILRGSYGLSDNFSVELSFAGDFYSGTVKDSLSDGDSNLSGYTFSLSGVYYMKEYNPKWIGAIRPLVLAGFGYRIIAGDLDYPVSGYEPGVGFLIGAGIQKNDWEFRLGYGSFLHDAKDPEEAYSSAGDQLDTSGIALEISYRFNIF